MSPPEVAFAGTDRYSVRERIGAGAMGVVYRVLDRDRDCDVALKTLSKVDPMSVYRFKREFRAIADISHPNLVDLYELSCEGDDWFFTMELLTGQNLYAGLLGHNGARGPVLAAKSIRDTATAETGRVVEKVGYAPIDRLRASFRQLVLGVRALHQSGYLHRDLKPSNVFLCDDDRVVILDFGIVSEVPDRQWSGDRQDIAGTVGFMAPEQADAEASEASDWYAVGSMLYLSLTGRRPFIGSPTKVLAEKRSREPPPPGRLRPDVPRDLESLCVELLRLDPVDRPGVDEILERLGDSAPDQAEESANRFGAFDLGLRRHTIVGHDRQRDAIRDAFQRTKEGVGVAVHVAGRSGMGKTSVVLDVVDEIAADREAVVLTGRCYEREKVPYKAVDSLIDALSRYLSTLPRQSVEILLPRDIVMLGRVFPVLRRVPAVANARRRVVANPEPHELRRRAFAALRELLARLAAQRPLVLFIDDVQWGDVDSVPLLHGLLRPPDVPPLLLIYAYRNDELEGSPILDALRERESELGGRVDTRHVEVGALPPAESTELARLLLREAGAPDDFADVIARESDGMPYFIHELVRYNSSQENSSTSRDQISLDDLIRTRIAQLSDDARTLVEVVALAGKPIPRWLACRAAQIANSDAPETFRALVGSHLIQVSGERTDDLVLTFHDRIRTAVLATLHPERRRGVHRRMAEELQTSDHPDVESLVVHLHGAGDDEAAADYAVEAADYAVTALAFDRAAELYRTALELRAADHPDNHSIRVRLGEALADAGRSADAAEAFLSAVDGATTADAIVLRRRAALRFLNAGHIDKGLATLTDVLERVGLKMPASYSLPSLLLRRAQLRLRGFGYKLRDESEISPHELARVDICWAAAAGLVMVDHFRGLEFQTRNALLALRSGEKHRIAAALAMEAALLASGGSLRRTVFVSGLARKMIEEEADTPMNRAWLAAADAMIAYQTGDLPTCFEHADRGTTYLRDECTGVFWERVTVELIRLWSLYYLGEIKQLSRRVEQLLTEAREHGDLYTEVNLKTGLPGLAWLAADAPQVARARIDEAVEQWSPAGFHLQHYYQGLAHLNCDLYLGDAERARERVEAMWPALERSHLLRIPSVEIEGLHLRGRIEIACATDPQAARASLAQVTRYARRIERHHRGNRWARAMAALLRAQLAHARGGADAVELFREAEAACSAAAMTLHALLARRRRVELGGSASAAELEQIDDEIRAAGVSNPARWLAMMVPLAGAESAEQS